MAIPASTAQSGHLVSRHKGRTQSLVGPTWEDRSVARSTVNCYSMPTRMAA